MTNTVQNSMPNDHVDRANRLLAICDTPRSVEVARRLWPSAILVTDNPILSDPQLNLGTILNTDALLSQTEALALGKAALELTRDLDHAVASSTLPEDLGLLSSHVYLTGALSRLISSLMHRAGSLARVVDQLQPTEIKISTIDTPSLGTHNPFLTPHFAHPARSLAEQGFFGERSWSYKSIAVPVPLAINETATKSLIRRMLVVPINVIQFEIKNYFNKRQNSQATVKVGELNEALREALPQLAALGIACSPTQSVRSVYKKAPATLEQYPQIQPIIENIALAHLLAGLERTGIFDEVRSKAVAKLICRHLSAGLSLLSKQTEIMRGLIRSDFPKGGTLLTNGLYGPLGAQAYGLYAEQGVRVVEFEHGVTAGIAALTNTKLTHRRPPIPDLHLVCSSRAASAFNANGNGIKSAVAVGLPDSVRQLQHARAQRMFARRALKLKRSEQVIMHVSTLPYFANHRPGLGAPTETQTYTIDKTLLQDVYPGLPHRVVFKQYPTQRFPFEPNYNQIFQLPPHISITKDEDFRYIRAAADFIVTMTPTSTLGWCAGTGAPIVWLASGLINPLADKKTESDFDAAFPTVDLDQSDWPIRLKHILLDLDALKVDWQKRETARQELYESAITGPTGSMGNSAAKKIKKFLQSGGTSSTAELTSSRNR